MIDKGLLLDIYSLRALIHKNKTKDNIMGAGCHYTHDNGEVAYWISLEDYADCDQNEFSIICDDVDEFMNELGYDKSDTLSYENGLAKVDLESTYYGDGLIIKLKERYEDQNIVNLFNANLMKMERRIAKKFNEVYPLRYATSGYTANTIPVGEFGKPKK